MVPAIQHVNDRVPKRTGVAPEITLDPEVLKDSTLGAFVGAMEGSRSPAQPRTILTPKSINNANPANVIPSILVRIFKV